MGRDTTILIDHARLLRVSALLRERQSMGRAAAAGVVTAAFFTLMWGLFAGVTGIQVDFLPILGGGFFVGASVRLAGRAIDRRFRVLAFAIALGAAGVGSVFASGYALQLQTGGMASVTPALAWGLFLDRTQWYTPLLSVVGALEAWALAGMRIHPLWLSSLAPRGGKAGFEDASRRPHGVACDKGHRWDPLRTEFTEGTGLACCPRCGEPVFGRVPADRIAAERAKDRRTLAATWLGGLGASAAFVAVLAMGLGRWRVDTLDVTQDTVLVSERTFDQSAMLTSLDLHTGTRGFSLGERNPPHRASCNDLGLTFREAVRTERGLVAAQPQRDLDGSAYERFHLVDDAGGTELLGTTDVHLHQLEPLGERLYTRTRDGIAALDASSFEVVAEVAHEDLTRIAVAPGRVAAGTEGGHLCTWSLPELVPTGCVDAHAHPVAGLALGANGLVATSSVHDGIVHLWAADTLEPQGSFRPDLRWQTHLAFSPDGSVLAVGGGSFARGGEAVLWDLSTHTERIRLQTDEPTVSALAFTDDGSLVAGTAPPFSLLSAGSRGRVYRFDPASGARLWTYP